MFKNFWLTKTIAFIFTLFFSFTSLLTYADFVGYSLVDKPDIESSTINYISYDSISQKNIISEKFRVYSLAELFLSFYMGKRTLSELSLYLREINDLPDNEKVLLWRRVEKVFFELSAILDDGKLDLDSIIMQIEDEMEGGILCSDYLEKKEKILTALGKLLSGVKFGEFSMPETGSQKKVPVPVTSGLSGKLFFDPAEHSIGSIAKYVYVDILSDGALLLRGAKGDTEDDLSLVPLYDKNGTRVDVLRSNSSHTQDEFCDFQKRMNYAFASANLAGDDCEIAKYIINNFGSVTVNFLDENKHNINGLTVGNSEIYVTEEKYIFHELGELHSDLIVKKTGINAHTFIRGCGKDAVLAYYDNPFGVVLDTAAQTISFLKEQLPSERHNPEEFHLIQYNESLGYTGADLLMGLENKIFPNGIDFVQYDQQVFIPGVGAVEVVKPLARRIKGVVWDWDGTIQDTIKTIQAFEAELTADFFCDYSDSEKEREKYKQAFLNAAATFIPLDAFFKDVHSLRMSQGNGFKYSDVEDAWSEYLGFYNNRFYDFVERYRETWPEVMPLFAGVEEMLQELKTKGIPMILASYFRENIREKQVEGMDFTKYFKAIYGAGSRHFEEGEYTKSAVMENMSDEIGCRKAQICIFEDSVGTIKKSADAGFTAIGFAKTSEDRLKMIKAGASIVIHNNYTQKEDLKRAMFRVRGVNPNRRSSLPQYFTRASIGCPVSEMVIDSSADFSICYEMIQDLSGVFKESEFIQKCDDYKGVWPVDRNAFFEDRVLSDSTKDLLDAFLDSPLQSMALVWMNLDYYATKRLQMFLSDEKLAGLRSLSRELCLEKNRSLAEFCIQQSEVNEEKGREFFFSLAVKVATNDLLYKGRKVRFLKYADFCSLINEDVEDERAVHVETDAKKSDFITYYGELEKYIRLDTEKFISVYVDYYKSEFGRSLSKDEVSELREFAELIKYTNKGGKWDSTDSLFSLRRICEGKKGFPEVCYEAAFNSARILVDHGYDARMIKSVMPEKGYPHHFCEVDLLGRTLIVDLVADCFEIDLNCYYREHVIGKVAMGITILPKNVVTGPKCFERAPQYSLWGLTVLKDAELLANSKKLTATPSEYNVDRINSARIVFSKANESCVAPLDLFDISLSRLLPYVHLIMENEVEDDSLLYSVLKLLLKRTPLIFTYDEHPYLPVGVGSYTESLLAFNKKTCVDHNWNIPFMELVCMYVSEKNPSLMNRIRERVEAVFKDETFDSNWEYVSAFIQNEAPGFNEAFGALLNDIYADRFLRLKKSPTVLLHEAISNGELNSFKFFEHVQAVANQSDDIGNIIDLKNHPFFMIAMNKFRFLSLSDITYDELPYGIRKVKGHDETVTEKLSEAPIVQVRFPENHIMLTRQSDDHKGRVMRLGFIENRPVAIHSFPLMKRGAQELIIAEAYRNLAMTHNLGYNRLHGVFRDEYGVNIVTDIVPEGMDSEVLMNLASVKSYFKIYNALSKNSIKRVSGIDDCIINRNGEIGISEIRGSRFLVLNNTIDMRTYFVNLLLSRLINNPPEKRELNSIFDFLWETDRRLCDSVCRLAMYKPNLRKKIWGQIMRLSSEYSAEFSEFIFDKNVELMQDSGRLFRMTLSNEELNGSIIVSRELSVLVSFERLYKPLIQSMGLYRNHPDYYGVAVTSGIEELVSSGVRDKVLLLTEDEARLLKDDKYSDLRKRMMALSIRTFVVDVDDSLTYVSLLSLLTALSNGAVYGFENLAFAPRLIKYHDGIFMSLNSSAEDYFGEMLLETLEQRLYNVAA